MKRINLLAGHYGSGKTNVAINLAINIKKDGKDVVIVDLDTVNPYFRTNDFTKMLNQYDIKMLASDYAGSNVDFPALPSSFYSIFDNKNTYAVIDIGGDDQGAYALGRYKDKIIDENNYDMFWVINKYRPLTSNVTDSIKIKNEIEKAAGINFTKIINNSNIGADTTFKDIENSIEYANNISNITNLPISMTTIADFVNSKNYEKNSKFYSKIFKIKTLKYNFREVL